jgi:hypothetical protein
MREYTAVPTLAQWQSDSCADPATRNEDSILGYIDSLIGEYRRQAAGFADIVVLSDLYFTVDHWLKSPARSTSSFTRIFPAMWALYDCVGSVLSCIFKCSKPDLGSELETYFCCTLSVEGDKVDFEGVRSAEFKRAELAKYRLRFVHGRAFQFAWWKPNTLQEWVLADSKRSANQLPGGRSGHSHYATFALRGGRELYLMKPGRDEEFFPEGADPIAGGAPDFTVHTGNIVLRNGIILKVRSSTPDPTDADTLSLLASLRRHGVAVEKILVEDCSGTERVLGEDFLSANGDWSTLRASRIGHPGIGDESLDAARLMRGILAAQRRQLAAESENLTAIF